MLELVRKLLGTGQRVYCCCYIKSWCILVVELKGSKNGRDVEAAALQGLKILGLLWSEGGDGVM